MVENRHLASELSAIDVELKSSHKIIDSLYKELDKHQAQKSDYEKLIKKCKNATEIYKSKIRSQFAKTGQWQIPNQ